jgi:hypothetical protein
MTNSKIKLPIILLTPGRERRPVIAQSVELLCSGPDSQEIMVQFWVRIGLTEIQVNLTRSEYEVGMFIQWNPLELIAA